MADVADSTPAPAGQAPTPPVFAKGRSVFANSHDVAAFFGKRHDHVFRTIKALLSQAPELALPKNVDGGFPSFGETPYIDPQNGQAYRSYDMDRDGFALLAMGFTGAKALRFKMAWIEAFNRMEAELRSEAPPPRADIPPLSPIPFLPGPERLVSSIDVARSLRRRHTGVLRLLDVLAAERPALLGVDLVYGTYLHENRRAYRCFRLTRAGFDALMAMIPSSDLQAAALRDATLAGWPKDAAPVAVPPATPRTAAAAPTPERDAPVEAFAPRIDHDGFAVMRIGGEVLVVDLMRTDPGPGRRAVVIGWDEAVAVADMTEARSHRRFLGARSFRVPDPTSHNGLRAVWSIGTVVASQPAAAPDKGAPARPRAAKPPRPRGALAAVRTAPRADLAAIEVCGTA